MAIRTERITMYGEDSTPYDVNVIIDDSNGGIAIDYTQSLKNLNLHLDRIATALEPTDNSVLADNLSDNLSDISAAIETASESNNIQPIVDQVTKIADSLETSDSTNLADIISSNGSRVADALETTDSSVNLADNISILRNLGETSGIRTVSPYDYITLISIYKLLIEENKLFDSARSITQTEKDQIKQRISDYIDSVDEYFPPKFPGGEL
jgi:hypothetical protein